MKKQSSFGNKLLVKILGVTILIFSITMFFVSKYSYENAQTNAQNYISEVAGNYVSKIEGEANGAFTVLRVLHSKFQESLNHDKRPDEKETIAFLKSTLEKNNMLLGLWWSMKDSEILFDTKTQKPNSPDNWYAQNGQFSPYITRSNGEIIIEPSATYNEEDLWIKGAKESNKDYITEPYFYKIDGVNTLMSTITIPLYKNGNYVGVIGAEIDLNELARITSKVKIYKSGYIYIIDSDGIIISHPKKDRISKKTKSMANQTYINAFNNAKNGEDYSFKKLSSSTGKESYYYTKPIQLKGIDNKNWLLFINTSVEEYTAEAIFIRNFAIIVSILGLIVISLVIYLNLRVLKANLFSISTGLDSFFKYLNKQSETSDIIKINSNDEFGQMAKSINENIAKIQKSINEDNVLIDDVKSIVNNVAKGLLDRRIDKNTSTDSLNELKNLLNDMLDKLEFLVGKNLNTISDVLGKYTQRDFTAKLSEDGSGKIGQEIIQMNNMITTMLQDSQKDGLSLRTSSDELTSNVATLSSNATSQAASLEETAASVDEITSNIQHTSEKAQEMLNISKETKNSANEGKNLATDTVNAMDDINETVININEAISVIDQIAFQTNILSLNAAVEAATAGEAGKGFAVVAQEVRNLASRSAEAAKEIKELVESATQKADKGKQISARMIEGFNQLEENITNTSNLIDDVSNAAKEQTVGMTQIADAMGQLDQFTQENAAIADKTNEIAKETNTIALDVVNNVDKNQFDGKNSTYVKPTPSVSHKDVNKPIAKKVVQASSNKTVTAQKEKDDEWESF